MSEIKPCPFCEAVPKQNEFDSFTWIECECGAVGPNDEIVIYAEIVEGWNTRPIEDALTASLNRASDACASVQRERDDLREKHDHLEHIIDRDRYIVAHGLQAIKKVLSGYDWLSEGRGSYEFDDERYQKEFGDALDAIRGSLKTLECLAFDKAHCTTDPNKVHAARHGALAFLARYEGGR